MRNFTILFCVLFSISINAQNDEIKHTIETFFEGFHHRDTTLLRQVCADKMILQSITENTNGNSFSEEPLQFFYRSIASMPKSLKYNEQILSYTTQVDGSLGHAWTPYEFYIDGKFSHRGVNAFTLFKEKDQWKIIYIIDTRRK
jgi:hypothetical protein